MHKTEISSYEYEAQKIDLDTIRTGLELVDKQELNFVFPNREFQDKVYAVFPDTHNLYFFWKENGQQHETAVPHNAEVTTEDIRGLKYGGLSNKFRQFVPKVLTDRWAVSGGLVTPLITEQQTYENSIYTTPESYIAQLPHEYAHAFYRSQNPDFHLNTQETLMYLETALGQRALATNQHMRIPNFGKPNILSETYACAVEIWVAQQFFPKFSGKLEKQIDTMIANAIQTEKDLDLRHEDSSLSSKNIHLYAYVNARILMATYSYTWPQVLISDKARIEF